jgi:hypothetical protein
MFHACGNLRLDAWCRSKGSTAAGVPLFGHPEKVVYPGVSGTGRGKFELFDWDGDGMVALLIGTPRHHSIPNPQIGHPRADGRLFLFSRALLDESQPRGRWPKILVFP